VVDVGGGDSRLVDALLERGFRCLAVLDVSRAALARAQARLGGRSAQVRWIHADVTGEWDIEPVDVWHDRATFHFLTNADDRTTYRARLIEHLRPHGHAVIATFAESGPPKCSGLTVVRYSPESLARELGPSFALMNAIEERHRTPAGAIQPFTYTLFRLIREPAKATDALDRL
jgi:SAM-dependent methyltransferase